MYKKIFLLTTIMALFFVTAACSGGTATAPTPDTTTEAVASNQIIKVENAWSRPATATMGGEGVAGNGVVYLTLTNEGTEADRLLSVTTDVANVAKMHETVMEGSIVKMQPIPDGIEIPAGEQIELKPGSYHIMLMGLNQDLNEGDTFSVTLELEKGGSLPVEVEVRQP